MRVTVPAGVSVTVNGQGAQAGAVRVQPGIQRVEVRTGSTYRRYQLFVPGVAAPGAIPGAGSGTYVIDFSPYPDSPFALVRYPEELWPRSLGYPAGWMGDGLLFTVARERNLLVDLARGSERDYRPNSYEIPVWSPDGSRIAHWGDGVQVARGDGSAPRQVMEVPDHAGDVDPGTLFWLDGDRLLVGWDLDDLPHYYVVAADGSGVLAEMPGVRGDWPQGVEWLWVSAVLGPDELLCERYVEAAEGASGEVGRCLLPGLRFQPLLASDEYHYSGWERSEQGLVALLRTTRAQEPDRIEWSLVLHDPRAESWQVLGPSDGEFAWSRDGVYLLYGTPGRDLVIWSAAEGREIARWGSAGGLPLIYPAPHRNHFWVGSTTLILEAEGFTPPGRLR